MEFDHSIQIDRFAISSLFTTCENTLCYIGENSDVEYGISFGGEMVAGSKCESQLKEKWQSTALRKIDEAYGDYMDTITEKMQKK